ncbi:hypothetical protein FORC20_2640 [Salmonella enterica subsp. enterica serovar Typhimurium]|nr:hypothetical protein FORC20_2640 [Salmonella enterica subsp. enterica serovar Typhimurium]
MVLSGCYLVWRCLDEFIKHEMIYNCQHKMCFWLGEGVLLGLRQ